MGMVSVHYAKTNPSRMIERALAGEDITIARGKVPALRLVPILKRPSKRQFGAMKGLIRVPKAFLRPMSRKELKLWYGE